jgi:phosphate acetyltransferase
MTNFIEEIYVKAKANKKHIVLPEGDEPRVLKAAAIALEKDIAEITILGDPGAIKELAGELSVNIDKANLVSLQDETLIDEFAKLFAELRKAKGVTYEDALATVKKPPYFGTLMVKTGKVDAMVSGANTTTAATIVPSFQIIKTKPGVSVVSGACLMALEDGVKVYADCAVNPNPTPDQIAEIAVSTAETAKQFGVDPKVALLSYSTGASGKGVSVDATNEAVAILKSKNPDFDFEGPIQYDAAVSEEVAKTKLPDSKVAGHANTFIFPDLNCGNITYKAVQRATGSLAIGPILQGLNQPVNDLSRGATVEDIVVTIAITAVQSQ